MKLNNKLKLSLIAIATLTTANVNAQTYYSCIPEGCPAGQYFDGKKCIALCPEGYISYNGKCCDVNYETPVYVKKNTVPIISNGKTPRLYRREDDDDLYYVKLSSPEDYVTYEIQSTHIEYGRYKYGKQFFYCSEYKEKKKSIEYFN